MLGNDTAVWSYDWNYGCTDSCKVYHDQGDNSKDILLFLVVFNISVFSFMVQKKSGTMIKIQTRKWTALTLMALTIVPVRVTMLDPFSHAGTWMRAWPELILPETVQVRKDTWETVMKGNFNHFNLYVEWHCPPTDSLLLHWQSIQP